MKNHLLSLFLVFSALAAGTFARTSTATPAPEAAACEQGIAFALKSSGLAPAEFSAQIGRVEGHEVLGITPVRKARKQLLWQDYLRILAALDEGLAKKDCAHPPFELLVVASEPEPGRGIARSWFAGDIQALHPLKGDAPAWEAGLKIATQGAGFHAH